MLRCLYDSVVVVVFFSLVARSSETEIKCDTKTEKNFCLRYFSYAATFKDAQIECKQHNLSLVTLSTKSQQEFLREFQTNFDPPIIASWIGLFTENGHLRWSSGYSAVPQIFISGRPGSVEGCAMSNISSGGLFTWEFIPCDTKLSFVCGNIPQISYRHPFSNQSTLVCPHGYKLFDKNCYLLREVPSSRLTWDKADEQCKASNTFASLATVTSPMEQDAISVLIARSSHPVWIGMYLDQSERKWIRGDVINYTNWYPKQILDTEKRLCTMMHQRPLHLGQWEEVDCSSSLNYICQVAAKPKISSVSSTSVSTSSLILTQGACKANYYEYNERCYHLYTGNETEISSLCGIKLSPYSNDETAFMRLLLQTTPDLTVDRAWTGVSLMYDLNLRSKWVYKTENNDSYYASMIHDFYIFSYKNVNLSTSSNSRFCVSINRDNTMMDVLPCSLKLPSICGYHLPNYKHPLPQDSNNSISSCPPHWIQFGHKCFSPIHDTPLPWSAAEKHCSNFVDGKAHLPSVHSPSELTFISKLYTEVNVWLGLQIHHEFTEDRSLALNKSSLYWSDESPVDYLSFALGEPSRHFSNGDIEGCFISHSRTHDWNDVNCNSRHLYFCQLLLTNVSAPSHDQLPEVVNNEICTNISRKPYCIRYISQMATFYEADYVCRNYNMTLATVPSEEHQMFIMNTLKHETSHSNLSQAYIGLFNSHDNLLWTSSYGAVPLTFWQLRFQNTKKKCVYIDTKINGLHTWGTISCFKPLPYICSTDISSKVNLSSIQKAYDNMLFFKCPEGFMLVSGSCFMIKANKNDGVDWLTASNLCRTLDADAHLATISSNEQQDGLTVLMDNQQLSAWIGLRSERNIHTWINQHDVVYTNWRPTELNANGSSCAVMHHELDFIGTWSNELCNKKFGYICEVKPTRTLDKSNMIQLLGMLKHGNCSSDFYMFNNTCYSVMPPRDSQRSIVDFHDEISGHCSLLTHATNMNCFTSPQLLGTNFCPVIATPHSPVEAAFMRLLSRTISPTTKSIWVGLKINHTWGSSHLLSEDNSLQTVETNLIDFSRLFQHKDSKAISLNKDTNQSYFDCFTMPIHDGNLIQMSNCSMHLESICSYKLGRNQLPTNIKQQPVDIPLCPKGWISFRENCYWLPSIHKRMSWPNAERVCQEKASYFVNHRSLNNGHLASVHSPEELQFLINLSLSSSFWIGLKAFYSGIKPTSSLNLVWSDGSVMDFSVFPSTDTSTTLNELENPENCISVTDRHHRYSWDINDCMEEKSFICQLSKLDLLLQQQQRQTTVMDDRREIKSPLTTTTTITTTCTENSFPIRSKVGPYCYSGLLNDAIDWSNAESICRNMHANAHLVSIHSHAELNEITEIIHLDSQSMRTTWIGLYESNFAYKWSDQTDINYIPVSADISKESRHYMQDCFVLDSVNSSINWKAMPCKKPSLSFICRLNLNPSTTILHPTTFDSLIYPTCPPGFRFHGDRCFQLITDKFTWSEANDNCHHIVKPYANYNGSLARIDNELDQQFLASLLDNLEPEKSSAVWIGLYRNLSHGSHSYDWSDGKKPQFIKPIIRDHQLSVYGHTFVSRPTISIKSKSMSLCTSMFRATDPRLNGIWLQWSCDEPIYLSSLCQASPIYQNRHVNQMLLSPYRTETFYCPSGFQLGTTGLLKVKGQSMAKLSQPMCYRVFNHVTKMNWASANMACKNLSTPTYNVSLLTIASVFEASFLRVWLNQPRDVSGGGLPISEAVWTALKVPTTCPGCYANWTWETHDNEPVRYTDWYKSPGENPGGCYLFHQAPYTTLENNRIDSGIGSIQLASSCETHQFVACQTLALINDTSSKLLSYHRITSNVDVPSTPHHQPVRPDCFKPKIAMSKFEHDVIYETKIMQSVTGRQCLRWDLIDHNFTDVSLDFNFIRNHLLSAEMVHGGSNTYSYAENYCSHIHDGKTQSTKFGCYISINPPMFENCSLIQCLHSVPTAGQSFHWSSGIMLFIFITVCCIFSIYLFRRIGIHKCIKIRRRYQPFDRYRTSRKRKTTLYLGSTTSTTDIVNNIHNNINEAESSSTTDDIPDSFLSSEPPIKRTDVHNNDNLTSLQISGPRKLNSSNGNNMVFPTKSNDKFTLSALNLSRTAASIGFMNPIYVPLNDKYAEDNYDPEPIN
ncbi:unnamed protein product [Schistosoma bovis]|nr:unnamed protein product [Schistosoma bovis]CAH8636000.1 unnamed protein product [Schistosoma bovis]